MNDNDNDSANQWTMFGSLGAAVAAAVCCLGPLVLVSLGVTGAWIGNLSYLEPYRPLFIAVAVGLLGFSFYRVYGRSRSKECGEEAECDLPNARRINRLSLWMAAVMVSGLFAAPYFVGDGLGNASAAQNESTPGDAKAETVTIEVEGMTCAGCSGTVRTALMGVDGVADAQVTFEPPQARVTYDPSRVSVDRLTAATAEVGYPTKPVQ